ncbi:Pectate lyase superfamily protein [compost metagenome]
MRTINQFFFISLLMLVVQTTFANKTEVVQSRTTLNIMDFGADNTGKADCSPAFDKLMLAMGDNPQIEVVLPAGRYRISKPVVFDQKNFSGYKENHGLVVRGAGEDVTEIICDNDEGGILFNLATNRISVTISDLSLVAVREGLGTALSYNTANQNAGDHHSRMFTVRNVLIRGEKFNKGYFENGVVCYNAWYPMLNNVKVTARYGSGSEKFKMKAAIYFEDSYSPLVTNSYVWGKANYGIYYRGTKTEPEDGIIKDTYLVGQEHGIYLDLSPYKKWAEPAFHVSNCHINYLRNGIFLKGVRQVFISNNLFYCHNEAGSKWKNDDSPVSTFQSKDINCDYTSDVIISNNQFTEPASPNRIGIFISQISSNILIQGNIFNFDAVGIRNESKDVSTAIGNVFGGKPQFAKEQIPYQDMTGKLKIIN